MKSTDIVDERVNLWHPLLSEDETGVYAAISFFEDLGYTIDVNAMSLDDLKEFHKNLGDYIAAQ